MNDADVPIELHRYVLHLDPKRPGQQLYIEVNHWSAEEASGGYGPWPAETNLLLGEVIDSGMVELTPEQARALVPLFHAFADQLGQAADQAAAYIPGGQ